jgi:hypothetical protein
VNSTSELDSYTNGIRRSLLSDVIQHADASSNHHFCYWLVRNYVANLCGACQESE